MTIAEFQLSTTSGQFATIDFGGAGPDLLLIHGTGQNALAWSSVAEVLVSRFHVVAFDMRGHGQTQETSTEPEQYWRDLGPITAALGMASPVLVGHSSGAYAATAYVASGGGASAVVCVDGFTLDLPETLQKSPSGMSASARKHLFETFRYGWCATGDQRREFTDRLLDTAPGDWLNTGVDPLLLRAVVDRCFVEDHDLWLKRPTLEEIGVVSDITASARIAPCRTVYDHIDVPLLLIWADQGLSADRYADLELLASSGNRSLISIASSHNVPMQHPAELAHLITANLHKIARAEGLY